MPDAVGAGRTLRLGRVSLLSALLAVASGAPAVVAQQKPVPYPDALQRMNESVDALTRKVWPSVVGIMVSSYGPRDPGREATPASSSAANDPWARGS